MAEDLAADVLLRAWEKLHLYQADSGPFSAWLSRIAHNRTIDYFRSQPQRAVTEVRARRAR
jgi:DNA-directed RNA polymerase specialized sigma24 family protein